MRIAFSLGILFCVSLVLATKITEVMYDPIGDENQGEFVEIYSLDNLSGYTFGDKSRNQTLQLTQWTDNPYALIVSTQYNRADPNFTFYTTGSQLGNGLSNTGDAVFLYFNNTLLDWMEYNKSAAPEGYTLERTELRWGPSSTLGGTPGHAPFPLNFTNPDPEEVSETYDPSNLTMQIWTDKLIYKPGEKMKLALEWSDPGQTAQIDLRNVQGDLLRTYPSSSRMISYTVTKNTSALWIQALNSEHNLTAQKVIGIQLIPLAPEKVVVVKEKTCPKIRPLKDPVRIVSFYTRTQKYQETLRLYVHLEGEGNYTLLLDSPLETLYRNITFTGSYQDVFDVKPLPNKNLFALQVVDINKTWVNQVLTFNLEPPNTTQTYSTQVSLTEKPLAPIPVNSSAPATSTLRTPLPPPIPHYTGTLESPSRVPSYLTYGLVTLFLLTLFALLRKSSKPALSSTDKEEGT